jgi:Helitron helicase-like domain at N-terminus/PIF1-like helicase
MDIFVDPPAPTQTTRDASHQSERRSYCHVGCHFPDNQATTFLKDPSLPFNAVNNKRLKTCFQCRERRRQTIPRRRPLEEVNGNVAEQPRHRPDLLSSSSPLRPIPSLLQHNAAQVERQHRRRNFARARGHTVSSSVATSVPSTPQSIPSSTLPMPSSPPPAPVPASCLPEGVWNLGQSFHHVLRGNKFEYCARCKEDWLEMDMDCNGICHKCRTKDSPKRGIEPCCQFFSAANNADPGPKIPTGSGLVEMTMIEECIIARCHVHMQLKRINGLQYRYTGHCVCFFQNVAKLYNELPLLPHEVDIVLLRPPDIDMSEDRYRRQFAAEFRVRRQVVWDWLVYLKDHNPEYRDIIIRHDNLSQLPEDGDVQSSMPHVDDTTWLSGDAAATEATASDRDPQIHDLAQLRESMVPNIDEEESEVQNITRNIIEFAQQHQLPASSVQAQPVSEFTGTMRLFAMSFPSLFPQGLGDWHQPRPRKMELRDWARHLLRYHDRRFGQHAKFRFYVYNMILRDRARKTAQYYIKQHGELNDITIEELQDLLQNDDSVLPRIVRYGSAITGTRPFWNKKGKELQWICRGIRDASPVFITLSAADHQWDDLMRHLPRFEEWRTGTPALRQSIVRENLQQNPHIVAAWLDLRFRLFKDHVLDPHLRASDYWYRFEWQARGSGHIHMLLWIKHDLDGEPGAPPLSEDPAIHQKMAEYWGPYITALDPNLHRMADGRPAAATAWENMENSEDFLSNCMHCFQYHEGCPRPVCQRLNILTGELECRFYFPRVLRDTAIVDKSTDHKGPRFAPARNHGFLNQCSPLIAMSWLANTDIQPATTLHGLLEYLGKYASKPEKSSASYKQMAKEMMRHVSSHHPALSFISKLMNRLVSERDYSAQEISHVLLQIPSVSASRTLATLDCRPEADQDSLVLLDEADDTVKVQQSCLKKYKHRSEALDDITLFDYLQHYDFRTNKRRPRAAARIINAFPAYDPENKDHYNDYCRVKLMLHHPFRQVDELRTNDQDHEYEDFAGAFEYCYAYHNHPADYYDPPPKPPPEDNDDDIYTDLTPRLSDPQAPVDFEEWTRMRPGQENIVEWDMDDLGARPLDRLYDWTPHIGKYPVECSWWPIQKQNFPASQSIQSEGLPSVQNLNPLQHQLYNTITTHYAQILNAAAVGLPEPEPLRINFDGVAGTGKTATILCACQRLDEMAAAAGKRTPVARAAPTGVAAHLFHGRTIHNLLKIPVRKEEMNLSKGAVQELQIRFSFIKYLIIDEKSMIGLKLLSQIDERLRQIFPANANEPWGGLSVFLCGDFFQLPPVAELPLYNNNPNLKNLQYIAGRNAYLTLNQTMQLTEIMRQRGGDQEALHFRQALAELRTGEVTLASWELLCTRVQNQLPVEEVRFFDNALRIFFTNQEVRDYNMDKLKRLGQPCKKILATHTGPNAHKATSDEAENLDPELVLSIGARVMHTANLWVEHGIVNGSMGTVEDIGWSIGADPKTDMPSVIMVKFDHYNGPSYEEGSSTVPIFPTCHEFTYKKVPCSRTMFPLRVSFAITVYKGQGLTIPRAVVEFGPKDFALGLSYVAVSRVKSLNHLIFPSGFDLSRFAVANKNLSVNRVYRELDRIVRLNQLL